MTVVEKEWMKGSYIAMKLDGNEFFISTIRQTGNFPSSVVLYNYLNLLKYSKAQGRVQNQCIYILRHQFLVTYCRAKISNAIAKYIVKPVYNIPQVKFVLPSGLGRVLSMMAP